MPRISLLFALLGPLSVGGCQSKVAECNALVHVMNSRGGDLAVARQNLVGAPREGLDAMADALRATVDAADAELVQLAPRDPTVRTLVEDYRALLQGVRASADDLTVAHRARESAALLEAAVAADTALATERDLVDRVNAYCSP